MINGLPFHEKCAHSIRYKRFNVVRLISSNVSNRFSYSKENYKLGTIVKTISKEEIEDKMKIVKSLEESGLLIKWTSETLKNEAREQESGFNPMLLRTLAVILFRDTLSGRGVITTGEGLITVVKNYNASTSFN